MKKLCIATAILLAIAANSVTPQESLVSRGTPTERLDSKPLPAPATEPNAQIRLEQCLVSAIDDLYVPAREAGVLQELLVREGAAVELNQLLARIDDARAKLQQNVATRQHEQARLQAQNDINVRFSQAAAKVSHAEHADALEVNKYADGAISQGEIRRLLLTAQRADLAIEQSQLEYDVARGLERVRAAELELAVHDTERRRLISPVPGVVVEIMKRPGEWVQEGERVLRLVRMDRLRIEGFVDARQFGDEEIIDRPVQVRLQRQRGQSQEFSGRIVFVSPLIEANGHYRVWAEVDNQQAKGRWLLRPGMDVRLTIEKANDEGRMTNDE
jgi:multidrug efflux pump subunit AcrA (membrane-fusion protein)